MMVAGTAVGSATGLATHRPLGGLGSAAATFDPATLFGASDRGIIYDCTDLTKLFQSNAGTTAVTTANDPIGYITDLSPNLKPATQATAANKPLLRGAPRTLGPELLTNGRIVDDTGFTPGTGWARSGATVVKTAGSASVLSWSPALVAGRVYQLSYTMTRTAGTLTPRFTGGTTVSTTARTAGGTYTEVFAAVTGNAAFEFSADATFAGSVKSVSLREVTSRTNMGAYMFGSPQRIASAAINFSNSDKMTVIYACLYDQATASGTAVAIGNWATTAGTIWCGFIPPVGRIRGDTGAGGSITLGTTDGVTGAGAAAFVDRFEFDLAQTALVDEVTVYSNGIERSGTSSGSAAGGGNWSSSATVELGVASSRITMNRVIVINRLLTPTETANAVAWVKRGFVFACVLGDSTVAALSGVAPIAPRVAGFCGGLVCGRYDVAESGRRIADMKTFFTALDDKSKLDAVVIQIGLNDVKGRVGENTATTATVIADLQDLVATVRAAVPAACRIYIAQMTPCKAWLLTATNGAAAYAAWTAVNEAIAGGGATPITGVDRRITSHVAQLSDGADNLASIHDYNNDGVHLGSEGRWITGVAWRNDAFEPDGLLLAAA
jgi:hypothetical protein